LLVVAFGIFAKPLISWLASNINSLNSFAQPQYIVTSKLSSAAVFLVLAFIGLFVYAIKTFFAKRCVQRSYQTWDCGQPINETMQYSATAFSAPIRFFFLNLLKREKILKSEPIVLTNPWIRKYVFSLSYKSLWKNKVYQPLFDIVNFFADRIKAMQGGRIQYYLLFVLGTLIVTLIIVL